MLYLRICVFVFVYLQVRHPGTLFLRSLYHHLSENIWFVWSKTSYSGDKRRCYQAGRTTNERTNERTNKQQWKIGLLSLWAVGRLSFPMKQLQMKISSDTERGSWGNLRWKLCGDSVCILTVCVFVFVCVF